MVKKYVYIGFLIFFLGTSLACNPNKRITKPPKPGGKIPCPRPCH